MLLLKNLNYLFMFLNKQMFINLFNIYFIINNIIIIFKIYSKNALLNALIILSNDIFIINITNFYLFQFIFLIIYSNYYTTGNIII